MPFEPVDEVTLDVDLARVYEHGWQSWSPTGLYDVTATSTRPELPWQHVMRFRPGAPLPDSGFQAEGLLAVDPGDGRDVRVYAGTDPRTAVPSIRAQLAGTRLLVSADGPTQVLTTPGDVGTALAHYGDLEHDRAGVMLRRAPTVWCSWYHYFLDVTQADVVENLDAMTELDLPVEVVQVDDGWQAGIGDWLELSTRFCSLDTLARRITDAGRRPGIWVAPFIVGERSRLAQEHPDWLMGDAGTNWDQHLFGLDLSRPEVLEYVGTVFRWLRAAGFDYFKLDFLYAGALRGERHGAVSEAVSEVAAYRAGLEAVRAAIGEEAFLLACGAPILPSVGLVDAMRVAADTYNPLVTEVGQVPLRGRAGVEARAWQQGRLWVNDADCLVARPAFGPRVEWAAVVERYSGLRSFSDRIADLDAWGLDTVRRIMADVPEPRPFAELPPDFRR